MTLYLVDFENVRSTGLAGVENLESKDKVVIFYSKNADALTFEAHMLLRKSSAEIETFMISKGGKNSLDFQLSTYLGYLVMENLYENIVIVSHDKGFLFAISFWKENSDKCKSDIFLKSSIEGYLKNEPFVEKDDENQKESEDLKVNEILEEKPAESDSKDTYNEKKKEGSRIIIAPKKNIYDRSKVIVAKYAPLKEKKNNKKDKGKKKNVETEVRLNLTNNVQNLVGDKYGKEDVTLLIEMIDKSKSKQELYQMLVKKRGQEMGHDMYVAIKGKYNNLKKNKM